MLPFDRHLPSAELVERAPASRIELGRGFLPAAAAEVASRGEDA